MSTRSKYIWASILLFGAVYYLVAELITIGLTSDQFASYYTHTISELSVPYSINQFSKSYLLMQSAFFVNGPIFSIGYYYLVRPHILKGKQMATILSIIVGLGTIMVGLFHCEGSHLLHMIATVITFVSGTMTLLWTSIYSTMFSPKIIRILCLFSFLAMVLTLTPLQQPLLPILERMVIYPIVFFQFVVVKTTVSQNGCLTQH